MPILLKKLFEREQFFLFFCHFNPSCLIYKIGMPRAGVLLPDAFKEGAEYAALHEGLVIPALQAEIISNQQQNHEP
jgi:hypothetical protein